LVHQVDPVAFLQTAARFAGPRGVLALHEPILDRPFMRSLPYVPLWQQAVDRVLTMFQAGAPSWDAAGRLIEHFSARASHSPRCSAKRLSGAASMPPTTPGSRTRLGPSCRRWCRAESRPPRRERIYRANCLQLFGLHTRPSPELREKIARGLCGWRLRRRWAPLETARRTVGPSMEVTKN
jgi:hypothetical protein